MRKLFYFLPLLCLPALLWAQTPAGQPPVVTNAGVYQSSPATCSAGNACYLQTDVNGYLKTTGSGGAAGPVSIADGADVAEGSTTDAAAAIGGTGTVSAKLRQMSTQLGTINTTLGTPLQAGGTVAATQSGTWTVQPGNTANTTPWLVSTQPATSGGLSVYFVQPTASDNHANIKNGSGQVYKIAATNNSATINYLRLYNAASGFNGCNSATNLVYQVLIPGNSTNGGGIVDTWVEGIAFSTGISICVTSGYATNDTTNATASAMSVNIGYK